MNTVSRKPHFGHPARHFASFGSSGEARRFPTAHHYERMSMRCQWQDCIVRWAQSGSAMWHSWMGCRGLAGGEGWQQSQRPIEGRRLGTRLALVLLPFHGMGRRRLLLLWYWLNGGIISEELERGGLLSPSYAPFSLLMAIMSTSANALLFCGIGCCSYIFLQWSFLSENVAWPWKMSHILSMGRILW